VDLTVVAKGRKTGPRLALDSQVGIVPKVERKRGSSLSKGLSCYKLSNGVSEEADH
jgi:hypothetical protein